VLWPGGHWQCREGVGVFSECSAIEWLGLCDLLFLALGGGARGCMKGQWAHARGQLYKELLSDRVRVKDRGWDWEWFGV